MTVGPWGASAPQGQGRAQYRVASADRDLAVNFLQKAYADGRLSKDEFDARAERALSAVSFADLDALVGDLPAAAPPYPGAPPQPGAWAYPTTAPRTNPLAVASLACGVGQLILGLLSGIPAIILGHIARRQIRRTGEQGAGMAMTGLVLGYLGVALTVVAIVAFILLFAAVSHQPGTLPAGTP